jgi:hypothetical protein
MIAPVKSQAERLRRHGLSPAPKRKQAISWKDFIRSRDEFFDQSVLQKHTEKEFTMN